jgi:hypothetical protein
MQVSSWSFRKSISGILFLVIGILNILLLEDAATIYFITAFPYYYLTGYPYVLTGLLLITYQILSYRKYIFETDNEGQIVSLTEIYPLNVWKREYSFKIDELDKIRFENAEVIGELIPLAVNWLFIWFFTREGMISIQNYFVMGAPLLLKIGLVLVITHICVTFCYLLWMIPVGRYQLRVEDRNRILIVNFGSLKRSEIENIKAELGLLYGKVLSNDQNQKIKTKNHEKRYILWNLSFFIVGSILCAFSLLLMLLDVGYYFTMGQFTETIIGYLGIRYLIYGMNRHYHTTNEKRVNISSFTTNLTEQRSLLGFRIKIDFTINPQGQVNDEKRQVSMSGIKFRQIGPFEIIFIGILFSIVIFQGFRALLNPIAFSIGTYAYPIILYQISAILIIALIIIALLIHYPSNDIMITPEIRKRSIIKRIMLISVLLGIPIILIAAGIPIAF